MPTPRSRINPQTKRGMLRTFEPDLEVAELSQLLWDSGLSWKAIAEAATHHGHSINENTISKIAYIETRFPRNSTRSAILAGLGITSRLFYSTGLEVPRMTEDKARERMRQAAKAKEAGSKWRPSDITRNRKPN